MRYSKIFHVDDEQANDFIEIIEQNGAENLMNILLTFVEDEWDDSAVYDEIPDEGNTEAYFHQNHILTWDIDEPSVCLYLDGNHEETERVIHDEEDNPSDIVDEALYGDNILYQSIRSLQEGDDAELRDYIINKVKEVVSSKLN